MAKPNYAFEKRQKELAKKQKKQEKLEQRKASHEADAGMESETVADAASELASTPNVD